MQGNLFVRRKYFIHYKIHNHPPSCPMETPFLLKCCHLHFSIKNKRKKKKKNEGNYLTDLTNEQRKECVNG